MKRWVTVLFLFNRNTFSSTEQMDFHPTETKFQIQRASEIMHLLRFHENMHFGCSVMVIFDLEKGWNWRFFSTLIWKDRTHTQQQNKPAHDYLSAFSIFVHVWVWLHVWETRVYDHSPQAEFILNTMLVHLTIISKFSDISILHHNQPIERIHPLISSPKNSQIICLYFCLYARDRLRMKTRHLGGHIFPGATSKVPK